MVFALRWYESAIVWGLLCSPESMLLCLCQAPGIRECPFPRSLSSVMDQALVCLFFWMMLWAYWRWGPCLNLWQTLNLVGFSLFLRAHLLESKSFMNHLPYLFSTSSLVFPGIVFRRKFLNLIPWIKSLLEKPKLRCHVIPSQGTWPEAVVFRLVHSRPERARPSRLFSFYL